MISKSTNAYKTIGEVVEILGLKSKEKEIIANSYNKILGKRI